MRSSSWINKYRKDDTCEEQSQDAEEDGGGHETAGDVN